MGKGNLLPIGVRSLLKSIIFTRLWRRPLSLIKECDHFILGGGGLFTDEERPLTGFFWAMHGLVASILMRKPVTVLGVSCGPMGFMSSIFTRLLFKSSQKVYCRDEQSVIISKKLGALNASLCPDMAAYLGANFLAVDDHEKHDKKAVYFILREYKNITKNVITNFVLLMHHLYAKYGFQTVLVDFQNDSILSRGMMNKIIDQNHIKNILSVQRIGDNLDGLAMLLRKAKFVFSMRYHGALLSLINSVPFISINYMAKSSNFWAHFKKIHSIQFSHFNEPSFSPSEFDSLIDSADYHSEIKRYSVDYREFAQKFRDSFLI